MHAPKLLWIAPARRVLSRCVILVCNDLYVAENSPMVFERISEPHRWSERSRADYGGALAAQGCRVLDPYPSY